MPLKITQFISRFVWFIGQALIRVKKLHFKPFPLQQWTFDLIRYSCKYFVPILMNFH